MKYDLFLGQSQPNVNAIHSHRTKKNNSSTGVGACVLILVDLL